MLEKKGKKNGTVDENKSSFSGNIIYAGSII